MMKLSTLEKDRIEIQCQPLIKKLKLQYVSENPNKEYNYLVDIYLKWYRDYLYFCEKYKSESLNRISDEFDEKFLRLKIINKDSFEFSYMRHTGTWFLIGSNFTLDDCLKMIEDTPTFHPIG